MEYDTNQAIYDAQTLSSEIYSQTLKIDNEIRQANSNRDELQSRRVEVSKFLDDIRSKISITEDELKVEEEKLKLLQEELDHAQRELNSVPSDTKEWDYSSDRSYWQSEVSRISEEVRKVEERVNYLKERLQDLKKHESELESLLSDLEICIMEIGAHIISLNATKFELHREREKVEYAYSRLREIDREMSLITFLRMHQTASYEPAYITATINAGNAFNEVSAHMFAAGVVSVTNDMLNNIKVFRDYTNQVAEWDDDVRKAVTARVDAMERLIGEFVVVGLRKSGDAIEEINRLYKEYLGVAESLD